MSAFYSFDVDPARDLVKITLAGFFTPADIQGFLAARAAAHKRLRCAPNAHYTLTDIREMKIQSQEIVGAFRSMLASPEYRSHRLAFIVGATLARTQVIRALDTRDARWFADPEEARNWLLEEERAA